ncbi:transglutaminase domain-containing protein [Pseudofulvibacter geojedonensis]|uniref:Transglutaminase domain-containing protein n=1 Tax=Pseudofulvibacter geojedonensis TaxID=1123758 RepID=A0ABW3I5H4_9FLAO
MYLLLFFFLQFSLAQDYSKVDAIVAKYPKKFSSINDLAQKIKDDFTSEEDRVRAAYYWVSNNISYDFKYLDSGKTPYKSIPDDHQYSSKLAKQKRKYANKCFSSKKAICEGYSLILNYIYKYLQIESIVIVGGTKQYTRKIGRVRSSSNHAWNAVRINNEWKLIDATWSTGNSRKVPNKFDFSDEYFFTPPENFILTHYPDKKEWQFLKKTISKETFYYNPIFHGTYFNSGLKINQFHKGLIKIKDKKSIKLNFTEIDSTRYYSYKFNNQKFSNDLTFKREKNSYFVDIPLPSKRPRELIIYDEIHGIIEFKLIP